MEREKDRHSDPGGEAAPNSSAAAGGPLGRYLLSLPERAVRSATAISAGLLRELGETTLPAPVRRSKLYRTMVQDTLRFLIEEVGSVQGAFPAEGPLSDRFAVRRAAGNGIELVGILAFRASPVWVLAALADLSGTGRRLVRDIAGALKQEGLLDPDTKFDSVDQILDGLEQTSGKLADTVNTPPLDVASLRRDWRELRDRARRIPPSRLPTAERLRAQWRDLRQAAASQQRSVFEVSSLMALSAAQRLPESLWWLSRSAALAARCTGQMFAGPLLDHYSTTLEEIRARGFLRYWKEQFEPYLRAAAAHFSPRRPTLTERILDKFRKRS
ncbi:MAG: hypothetical protein V3U98_01810 [Acidobacteriota bacterium]